MASQIDFAIAVGLFFAFISVLIIYMLNYLINYSSISTTSELRTVAHNIYTTLFADKGIPKNWTEGTNTPLKVGLVTDMYRVPVLVNENSSADRGNVTLNLSLSFDGACNKNIWNNTVRVIGASDNDVPVKLYNQTFCSQQLLRTADIVFNDTFSAGQTRNYSIYFSQDKNITGPNYTTPFPSPVNFNFVIYPEEKLKVVSAERLLALRRLNYTDVLNTLSKEYYFNLRISTD